MADNYSGKRETFLPKFVCMTVHENLSYAQTWRSLLYTVNVCKQFNQVNYSTSPTPDFRTLIFFYPDTKPELVLV